MDKHTFKVGDKVKLRNPTSIITEKVTGVIIDKGLRIRILWDIDRCLVCKHPGCSMPVKSRNYVPESIKRVIEIGEQLMLFEI